MDLDDDELESTRKKYQLNVIFKKTQEKNKKKEKKENDDDNRIDNI